MAVIGILASILIVLGGLAFLGLVLLIRTWRAARQLVSPVRRCAVKTPADFGLAHERLAFPTEDGLTLRGWWIPATGQARGTILFSHGYAGDCSPDLIYAPVFVQAGYNVCLFDYRGHGDSDGEFTSLVHFERGDLLCALAFLRTRGVERVGLIGFSMGGAIALAAASQSPMVVGVISDCAFAEVSRIVANAAMQRGAPRLLANLIGWLVELLASIQLRANLFAADPIRWVGRIAPRPLLIMHGGADEAVPVSEAHRLYAAAREPKELWIVPGAGHRRIEDVAPDAYCRRIVDFIDRAFQDRGAMA